MSYLTKALRLLVLAALVAACSGQTVVGPAPASIASAQAGQPTAIADPSAGATEEPTSERAPVVSALQPAPTPDPPPSPAETATDLNEVAVFDAFVMDRFEYVGASEFARLQVLIEFVCEGGVTKTDAALFRFSSDVVDDVFTLDQQTCDRVVRSPFGVDADPTNADTWSEAVAIRYSRVVWWASSDFADRAVDACNNREDFFSLTVEPDTSVSLSAMVELGAMLKQGDCDLLYAQEPDDVESVDAPVETAEGVPGIDAEVYFSRSEDESETFSVSNIFAVSLRTGEVRQVTNFDEHRVYSISSSVDGSTLGFVLNRRSEAGVVHVIDSDGSNLRSLGERNGLGGVLFTSDGASLLLDNVIDGEKVFFIQDIASGTKRPLLTPRGGNAFMLAVHGDTLIYRHTDGFVHTFERFDLRTEKHLDSKTLGYIGSSSVAPDGTAIALSETDPPIDDGELAVLELTETAMNRRSIENGRGLESGPRFSPDGTMIAYGVGPQWKPTAVFVTALEDPTQRVNLTAALGDREVITSWQWLPDSTAMVVSTENAIYVTTLDGRFFDLGLQGTPRLVLPT